MSLGPSIVVLMGLDSYRKAGKWEKIEKNFRNGFVNLMNAHPPEYNPFIISLTVKSMAGLPV